MLRTFRTFRVHCRGISQGLATATKNGPWEFVNRMSAWVDPSPREERTSVSARLLMVQRPVQTAGSYRKNPLLTVLRSTCRGTSWSSIAQYYGTRCSISRPVPDARYSATNVRWQSSGRRSAHSKQIGPGTSTSRDTSRSPARASSAVYRSRQSS